MGIFKDKKAARNVRSSNICSTTATPICGKGDYCALVATPSVWVSDNLPSYLYAYLIEVPRVILLTQTIQNSIL